MRAALTALFTATVVVGGCEPFLADLPDLLPPTDGPDAGDTAPPTVFFAAPDDNADVAGTIAVEVSAVDAEGPVRSVALTIDDVAAGTRETPPFNFDVDTAALTDGRHAFKAIATDASDNTAEAAITLVVTNIVPQLQIDAPLATQSDRDVDVVVTSQVPLRSLALQLGNTVVESRGDDARLVFTATARIPPASAPVVVVRANGIDDEEQQATTEFTITVDDTARAVSAQVEPITDTHVASPFEVAIAVADDEAGAAGAPIVACAVCAAADGCNDDDDFVAVELLDGACGSRADVFCTAGDDIVIVARVIDAAGNIGTSTLTRTCSPAPTAAPVVEAINTRLDATTTIRWTAPAAGAGDVDIDHFVVTTRVDGGEPVAVEVPGLLHTLTLPACARVDVEVVAVDVFGRVSPAGARRGQSHCGHDGTFTTITLELDTDGSANLGEMNATRDLATVAAIDLGDVEQDGDVDVVVFGERSNGARRLLRLEQRAPLDGAPMFVGAPLIDPTTNGNARQVALTDLNADGLLDIVAMTPQATALLAGTGGGTFAAPTVFALGRTSAVVGPVTRGDALPDVLVAADSASAILPGSRGPLTSTACSAGGVLLDLVDADGLPGTELVVYDESSDLLRVRKRDGGDPTCPFSAVSTDLYTATVPNLVAAVVLDTDGNGRPDLARLRTRSVVIDRDAASDASTATEPINTPQDTVDAAAIDLESDGDDDLVVIDDRTPGNVRFIVVEDGALTLGEVIPLAGRLKQVMVRDIDGDGIDDVIVAAENPSAVHILKGGGVRRRGDGGAEVLHEVSVADAVGAAPIDIDRDGDLDVVSTGSAGIFAIDVDLASTSTVQLAATQRIVAFTTGAADVARGTSVFFGTASGDWALLNDSGATEVLAAAFGPARALSTVDLDDDGDLDSLGVFPQLAVRLNQGASFVAGPAAPTTTANAVALAVADVDLDGLLDVVIAGDEIDIVGLQPTLTLKGTLTCEDGPATDVAIADVDNDGHADVLAACAGPTPSLLVARNTGDSPATFSTTELVVGGDSGGPMALGDVDGDGDADVVLGSVTAGVGVLRLLRNEGGGFVAADFFDASGRTFVDVELVDLDDDGVLDVIAAGDGTVVIFKGTAAAR